MKLPFGYEILLRRRVPVRSARERLLDAVKEANAAWAAARGEKLWLSLWIDWGSKELTVTKAEFTKVPQEA